LDAPSQSAATLIESFAACHRRLMDLAAYLRQQPGVVSTATTVDCIKFERSPSPILAVYVEAELKDGTAMCWTLELSWEERTWVIDGGVSRSAIGGQGRIRDVCDRRAERLEELLGDLREAAEALDMDGRSRTFAG